jgi:hypothetical protein
LGDAGAAESGLRTALSTALALGSVPARVDAARHLAGLLRASGRIEDGIDTLERALRTLVPGSTPRVDAAMDLLAELREESSSPMLTDRRVRAG